jgi:cell division protease FtsH
MEKDNKTPAPKTPRNLNNKSIANFLAIGFSVILIFVVVQLSTNNDVNPLLRLNQPREFSDLITDIRIGKVSKIEVSEDKSKAKVELYKDTNLKDRSQVDTADYKLVPTSPLENPLNTINNGLSTNEKIQVGTEPGKISFTQKEKPALQKFLESDQLWTILLIGSSILIAIIFLRRIAENNSKAISFGNSRAKLYDEPKDGDKITFAEVAGNEEAKTELLEVVDFLKRPEAYTKMGAKIPRGVLLIGSPGNGKTMMAKAVAGEANVPFLYVSGSEFVEMFVGVGASRVRDLFKAAKKKAPCVIFIDEIDAVGRKRGQGIGGGNDEREQTLNQFLVEMDGFEGNESVIVLGATNRPDVLDPALLRPGRFDRQVTVTVPDRKERLKILEVHAKNKKMAEDTDLSIVAKRTSGFSGADLMNVLNESAILAVRNNQPLITNDDMREAIEKVMLGPSLKSKLVSEEQKKLTAFHEAGHALTATVLPKATKVQKITIVPRGKAAGYTFHADDDEARLVRSKLQFLSEITVLFGGYTVEEMIFGDVTTGASNDLAKATEIARNMVTKYGMSSLGAISLEESSMSHNDVAGTKVYGEKRGNEIDIEVSKILATCQDNCRAIVSKYQNFLDQIANKLLEEEVLEYEKFDAMVESIKDSFEPKFVV